MWPHISPLFLSINSLLIYLSIGMHSLCEFCYSTSICIHKECRSVLVKLHPITLHRTVLRSARFLCWIVPAVFFGLPIVSCSMINSLILGCLWPWVFVLTNILTLCIWRPEISYLPGCLPLDLLSEYRIQHGAIGPIYVTSNYSTWIFCRWVSGFATDCPCSVWCRGLTTSLLYVCPLFGYRLLNNSSAIGLI